MNEELKTLLAVAEQIVADVDEASALGDPYGLYENMLANVEDLQRAINNLMQKDNVNGNTL